MIEDKFTFVGALIISYFLTFLLGYLFKAKKEIDKRLKEAKYIPTYEMSVEAEREE